MYSVTIMKDRLSSGGIVWVAHHPSVHGPMGQGDTPELAEADLADCLEDWRLFIEAEGEEMPPPDVPLMRAVLYT